jgi:hypothetical protein
MTAAMAIRTFFEGRLRGELAWFASGSGKANHFDPSQYR